MATSLAPARLSTVACASFKPRQASHPPELSASRRTQPYKPLLAKDIPDSAVKATGVKPAEFREWLSTADCSGNDPPLLLSRFVNDRAMASLSWHGEEGQKLEQPRINFSQIGLEPDAAEYFEEKYNTIHPEGGLTTQLSFTQMVNCGLIVKRYEAWLEQQLEMSDTMP